MKFEKLSVDGLILVRHNIIGDERGYFVEDYNKNDFVAGGIDCDFVQDNRSYSKYGTLRGLHFQKGEHSQAKLVKVLQGKVLDVAVDMRKSSKTFGQHFSIELQAGDGLSFFIPRGFAHGFVVLSESALFSYKCDNFYNKNSDAGVFYGDKNLGIDWKINNFILSDKDKILPNFCDAFVFE